jgi:hypothetical protein
MSEEERWNAEHAYGESPHPGASFTNACIMTVAIGMFLEAYSKNEKEKKKKVTVNCT